ncbi:MAG: redoxin domain-containing protein [Anaerolineales bacterium]|nr:redoxin domain-containing protein [Anaerolineales bacterium]MBK9780909.1 redoxin domain-containing protein [Anaerolineales bacterium]
MSYGIYGSCTKIFGHSMNSLLLQNGEIAPDFTLEDINGNLIQLSSYRGNKPVLLSFLRGFI